MLHESQLCIYANVITLKTKTFHWHAMHCHVLVLIFHEVQVWLLCIFIHTYFWIFFFVRRRSSISEKLHSKNGRSGTNEDSVHVMVYFNSCIYIRRILPKQSERGIVLLIWKIYSTAHFHSTHHGQLTWIDNSWRHYSLMYTLCLCGLYTFTVCVCVSGNCSGLQFILLKVHGS